MRIIWKFFGTMDEFIKARKEFEEDNPQLKEIDWFRDSRPKDPRGFGVRYQILLDTKTC